MVKRAYILIKGLVQGVFYRSSMKEMANFYGVKGWVRNLPSGEVEAEVEGEDSAISNLIDWCWQGPPSAKVDRVEINWVEPRGEFKSFSIKR